MKRIKLTLLLPLLLLAACGGDQPDTYSDMIALQDSMEAFYESEIGRAYDAGWDAAVKDAVPILKSAAAVSDTIPGLLAVLRCIQLGYFRPYYWEPSPPGEYPIDHYEVTIKFNQRGNPGHWWVESLGGMVTDWQGVAVAVDTEGNVSPPSEWSDVVFPR